MAKKPKSPTRICPDCSRPISIKRFVGEICRECDSNSRAAHMSDKFSSVKPVQSNQSVA